MNSSQYKNHLNNIYVNDEYGFLFCRIPKTGISNWKRIMLYLLSNRTNTDVFNIPDSKIHTGNFSTMMEATRLSLFPTEGIACRLKHYLKVVFVRHPLDRLLSAYRSKFYLNTTENSREFFRPFGRKIIRRYRRRPTRTSLKTGSDVTFQEFLRYVLDRPVRLMDRHWMPYDNQCFPCEVNYDVIGKHETMTEDANYLLDLWNVSNIRFPPAYRNASAEACEYNHFYSNVSAVIIDRVIDKFKEDSLMFGYSDFPEFKKSAASKCTLP